MQRLAFSKSSISSLTQNSSSLIKSGKQNGNINSGSSLIFSKNDSTRVNNSAHRISKNFATSDSFRSNFSSIPNESTAFSAQEAQNRNENANLLRFITAYRRYGHAFADIDPLNLEKKVMPSELEPALYGLDKVSKDKEFNLIGLLTIKGKQKATLEEITQHLKQTYCGNVASEFSFIQNAKQRKWFAEKLESLSTTSLSKDEKLNTFKLVTESETFDHYMHKKFPFVKRYGLEGNESMIPAIDTILSKGAELGLEDVVIAMPHRGRLNLLVGLLQYPSKDFFWKVKGNTEFADGVVGTGDVISHIGHSVDLNYANKSVHVSLIQNPSHLEAVDPVALGKIRAKQDIKGDKNREKSMCLMLHGDASIYGQGVVTETFGLSKLKEFSTGGTVHIIVNNQLGFTAGKNEGRSSRYSSDVGKMVDVPTIHVNSNSPEDVVKACKIAIEYRQLFKSDIIIDIIGFRKHGHNELDEPSFTQPAMYKTIRAQQSIPKNYATKLEGEGLINPTEIKEISSTFESKYEAGFKSMAKQTNTDQHLRGNWKDAVQAKDVTKSVDTGYDVQKLKEIALKSVELPGDFQIHNRLKKFTKGRTDDVEKDQIDWPTAEAISFGSLLQQGYSIRLCGQDSGRGTFSQRHAVLVDQANEKKLIPFSSLSEKQGKFEVINSPLSEFAVLGYEYGYSIETPKTLNIWEAQFGDFANGAQIIIDTFISCGEAKWLKQTGLVMLLPHGYDGTGPEHSSGRIERYLQLSDSNAVDIRNPSNLNPNMIIVNPTTPANYFHLLRRQQLTQYRKPLIVMAPKILLRHDKAISSLNEMAPGTSFKPVIGDSNTDFQNINRIIFCSGKVYYNLIDEREKRGYNDNTAIIRIEELVPFPVQQIEKELSKYKNVNEYLWVQDESQNAGAWLFVQPRLNQLVNNIKYIGREPCPAVSTGIGSVHTKEYNDMINSAFPSKQ